MTVLEQTANKPGAPGWAAVRAAKNLSLISRSELKRMEASAVVNKSKLAAQLDEINVLGDMLRVHAALMHRRQVARLERRIRRAKDRARKTEARLRFLAQRKDYQRAGLEVLERSAREW